MKLRAPAFPLITVDPYFSVWSFSDKLNEKDTVHWSGKRQALVGVCEIDGKSFSFLGDSDRMNIPKMKQISVYVSAFKTIYKFVANDVKLEAMFFSPLLPTDLNLLSVPVSYLNLTIKSLDGKKKDVKITVKASEELCLEFRDKCPVLIQDESVKEGITAISMGGIEQPVLGKSGDGICIDWGYFYLAANNNSSVNKCKEDNMSCVSVTSILDTDNNKNVLITFSYDDIYSIKYFGEMLSAYWKKSGNTIKKEISLAYDEYELRLKKCDEFEKALRAEAIDCGGEKYADLLELSLRQVLAAHKLVTDTKGKLLYISKECYSNGCAATVDVSYPSMPLFLIYNPKLMHAMLRPVFRYANSDAWPYEFAPHDVGTYPILNGQVYSGGTEMKYQMPIEECGNMLLMVTATAIVMRDFSFAKEFKLSLDMWAEYLYKNGFDPENQLCTDDFAGHLAHNANLSLKAIMALCGYSYVCEELGFLEQSRKYKASSIQMAKDWVEAAANEDKSFKLAFDQEDTFSMKYNMIWDKLFQTNLFSEKIVESEFISYFNHINPYGMPLDNRSDYTKSDWLVWVATLARSKEEFMTFIEPLWLAYNLSPSRVPMTDWYSTITSLQISFQNRTVQGGLFMKLLDAKGICKIKEPNLDKTTLHETYHK